MNRMASTVIAGQNAKEAAENEQIHKYEQERELRLRLEDEKRMNLAKQRQIETREYLYRQMAEKKDREAQEKALNDQQAVMWQKDKELFETEE